MVTGIFRRLLISVQDNRLIHMRLEQSEGVKMGQKSKRLSENPVMCPVFESAYSSGHIQVSLQNIVQNG